MALAKAFLAAYGESCNISAAARAAQPQAAQSLRRSHYRWVRKYPKYAKAFEHAKELAGGYLLDCAVERATVGWDEPIHYKGKRVGWVRRFDGGLAQFLLRGFYPEMFNRQTVEHSGPNGAPLESTLKVIFVKSDGE